MDAIWKISEDSTAAIQPRLDPWPQPGGDGPALHPAARAKYPPGHDPIEKIYQSPIFAM
jgi:hypothetical protein